MSQASARPPKLISLEIARYLAALIVVLEHLSTTLPHLQLGPAPFQAPASAAVLFFFTLSGFVIHNAHHQDAGHPTRLPRYFWRRFCRIYPLYWLSLLPMLAVLYPGCTREYLIRIFTLTPFTGALAEMNPPAWTLRYELLFYLIFGLALLPGLRRVLLPLWAASLAAAWARQLLGWGMPATMLPFIPAGTAGHLFALNNIMFFAGLGAGWVFTRWRPKPLLLWPFFAASLLALAVLLRADGWGTAYAATGRVPFTAAAFAAVILGLAALERAGQLRIPKSWAILGAMSYPLYLMHPIPGFIISVQIFYHPAARHLYAPMPTFWGLLACALLLGTAATLWFDAPLQRLARKLL